jgi:SAM-dependent methyltransferase
MHTASDIPDAYPWERGAVDDDGVYLRPTYYDALLKDYSFSGCLDTELLAAFLSDRSRSARVAELGSGTGRATSVILEGVSFDRLVLIDLSELMVARAREIFGAIAGVELWAEDSIDALVRLGEVDLLVSLWSISPSVHSHLFRLGRARGEVHVCNVLEQFLRNQLKGEAFIVHFDMQSDEQRLINPWRAKIWRALDPSYDPNGQSPSKCLLDRALRRCADLDLVRFSCTHRLGDPIQYDTPEMALEVFMSFHLEGLYSGPHPDRRAVVESLLEGFEQYRDDGGIRIRPGCFVYEIART